MCVIMYVGGKEYLPLERITSQRAYPSAKGHLYACDGNQVIQRETGYDSESAVLPYSGTNMAVKSKASILAWPRGLAAVVAFFFGQGVCLGLSGRRTKGGAGLGSAH
jgi:hypothetical protein